MATFLSKETANIDTVWHKSLMTQVEVEKISHGREDEGKIISEDLEPTPERDILKSIGITQPLDETLAILWENGYQKPLGHRINLKSFKSSECSINDCLSQPDFMTVNEASSGPVSFLFQTGIPVGNDDDSGPFSSDKKRSMDQDYVQELNMPLLKDETSKGKCYSQSIMYNAIQTGENSIPRKGLQQRKFLCFFQKKSSGSCSEVCNKPSGDGNCVPSDAYISSTTKAAHEGEHYATDTRCDTDSESEKETTGYCFHFKIISCLKIHQKKSKGNKQITEEEQVKESKATASTGWRQVLSDVVSYREEGNTQTQILRRTSAPREYTLDKEVVSQEDNSNRLYGTHVRVQNKSSLLEQRELNIKDSMLLQKNYVSAAMNDKENVEQAHSAHPETSIEGTVKSRKYLKMKPWRTVPYLTSSETHNVPNLVPIKLDPDTTNRNAVTITEYCDELEGGADAFRPYSKLSFFRKIRRYNRLRKTAGGLNTNLSSEYVNQDKHAFESAATSNITANRKTSESFISHEEVSCTQRSGLTGPQEHVAGTEIVGSIVSQEGTTKIESNMLSKSCTEPEVESYMASVDATVKMHVVAHENANATEVSHVVSQEVVIAEEVECLLESKCNSTAAAGPTASLENVKVAELKGYVVTQEDAFAAKKTSPLKTHDHVLATRFARTTVSQKDVIGEGSMVFQDNVTVAIPVVSQEDVAAAYVPSPITFQECFTTAKLADTISTEVAALVYEVETVKSVKLCNENLDGTQPIFGEKHVSTGEQAKTLPNESLTCDIASTMQEAKGTHAGACCNTEHERNDEMVPEISVPAAFEITPEMKYSLAIPIDFGNYDKQKQLANSSSHKSKWNSQGEAIVQETLLIEPCGELASQHPVDKNEGFIEKLKVLQHLKINNLTEDLVNGNTAQMSFPLAHCSEFLEHEVLRDQNEWDVPLFVSIGGGHPIRGLYSSSQETAGSNLSEALDCGEIKEKEPGMLHVISASSNQKDCEFKNEKVVVRGIRSYCCPDGNELKEETHNASPPSLVNSPNYHKQREKEDTFEGRFTGSAFWSEEKNRNFNWIDISANVKPKSFDATDDESNSKSVRGPRKADRWTTVTLSEMSSINMDTQEKENSMLYETAVATVRAAIQAATGHIALWQQERDWAIQAASSPGAAASSCVKNPMTTGKGRLPQKCIEPECT